MIRVDHLPTIQGPAASTEAVPAQAAATPKTEEAPLPSSQGAEVATALASQLKVGASIDVSDPEKAFISGAVG